MYCNARNFLRASDKNGGPLLRRIFVEGHIRKLSSVVFKLMDSANFEELFYIKGYLLKVSATRRYSLSL